MSGYQERESHMKRVLQVLVLMMLFAVSVNASTYYIDFAGGSNANVGTSKATAWKLAPGMPGFVQPFYVHHPGDIFIFKGGVTWPKTALPLTVKYSGVAGAADVYGGEDQTWFAGPMWSQPIVDGQQLSGPNAYLIGDGGYKGVISNVRIDNFLVKNAGNKTDSSGTGISFGSGGSNIEISRNTVQPMSVQSIAYSNGYMPKGSLSSHILIHDNKLSMGGRFIVYGLTGSVVDDVQVYGNEIQGAGAYNPAGYHLDGLMIGNPTSDCAKVTPPKALNLNATVTHISFHHNVFKGFYPGGGTAQYFANSCTNYTSIFDNVFSVEGPVGTALGYAIRFQSHDGNISIFNNTFSSDAAPGKDAGYSGAVTLSPTYQPHYGALLMVNNIVSGFGIDWSGFVPSNWSSVLIDYNLHNLSLAHGYGDYAYFLDKTGKGVQCKTLACVQKTWGFEMHSLVAVPMFTAVPNGTLGSGNFRLLPGSPAIGKGMNLYNLVKTDAAGQPRPATGPWDIGAFGVTHALTGGAAIMGGTTSVKVPGSIPH